ncbi:MAG: hypothetical protein HQL63_16055, partial [Magnetococcales bacterium]|nr:hypothetical protein [Magnetococcales bacterium]
MVVRSASSAWLRTLHGCSIVLVAAFFGACGGGGGGGGTTTTTGATGSTVLVQTGTFVDDPVDGVTYTTATQSGVTGNGGQFKYAPGELVTFSVGGIQLGQPATAKTTVTPVDLVPGATSATNATVKNIASFLQSLNSAPGSGKIVIPTGVHTKLVALKDDSTVKTLNFSSSSGFSTILTNVMAKVTSTDDYKSGLPTQVAPDVAAANLEINIAKAASATTGACASFAGTWRGGEQETITEGMCSADSYTDTVIVKSDCSFTALPTNNRTGEVSKGEGMFTDTGNGNFSFKEKIVAGSGAGSFEMSGSGKVSGSTLSFNGSWTNSGCSGTTQGNLTLSTASSGTSSPSSSGTSSGTNSPSSSGTSSGTNSPSSNTSSAKPTKLADLAGTWKVQGQSATFTVSSSGDTSAFDYVSKVSGWCFLGEPFSATIPATPGAVDSSNFGMKLFYSKGENSY